jgi:DNA-binding CsgD family transcriptional regulator
MSGDESLVSLVDLIYEAVLDGDLWPSVLAKLADSMGAMQTIVATMDRRSQSFSSIARRSDPELVTSYREYWAFHNPLWTKTTEVPVGKVFSLDTLMPRQEFITTPVFNEWWQPADYGLGMLGANLRVEDNVSSLICVVNAPGNDFVSDEQTLVFKTVLRHLDRALRIHRQLWALDLNMDTAPERLGALRQGALLVDAEARVLFANAPAKAMLDSRDGLVLRNYRLAATDGSDALQKFIASCVPCAATFRSPGGELTIRRGPLRSNIHVSVTPLRAKGAVAEVPWLGLRAPVAIVMVTDPEIDQRRLERNLRSQFGLTTAESRLAAEIVKGDGRKAAAQRRGISDSTARTQLSSIFAKTGTHRQAQLVRLLNDAAEGTGGEK